MKKRLISGAVFIAILALSFILKIFVSNYFFDAMILGISCVATWEMASILSKTGKYNNKIIATIFPSILMTAVLLCINYESSINLVFTITIAVATIVIFFVGTFLYTLITRKTTRMEIKARKIQISACKFSLIKALNTTIAFVYPAFL